MKKSSMLLCCFFSYLLLIGNAIAGNKANQFTFTAGVGYEYFAQKRHIKNATVPLAILGYNFTSHWGIEALLGQFNTKFKNNQDDDRQINGTTFSIDGVYRFCPYLFACNDSLEPFLLAGVGVQGLNPNGTSARNETNVNVGAGLQYFFNELVAFRLEARDFYTMSGGKNDVMVDAGVTFLINLC